MNKRLFKKLVSLLICIAVFISLMGCSSNQDAKQSQIELIDQAGRTVTLEQPAQKIVSWPHEYVYIHFAGRNGDNKPVILCQILSDTLHDQ